MFSGTGSTAVACMLLQRHFMGCDVDDECVTACKLRLIDLCDGGSDKFDTLLDAKGVEPSDWRTEHVRNSVKNPACDDYTPVLVKGANGIESAKVCRFVLRLNVCV